MTNVQTVLSQCFCLNYGYSVFNIHLVIRRWSGHLVSVPGFTSNSLLSQATWSAFLALPAIASFLRTRLTASLNESSVTVGDNIKHQRANHGKRLVSIITEKVRRSPWRTRSQAISDGLPCKQVDKWLSDGQWALFTR